MIFRLYQASELGGGLPVDKQIESRTPSDRPSWVYGYNLSPFAFEIQEEGGNPLTIAQPFTPFKHRLMVRRERLTFHAIAQQTINLPIAAGQYAVYATVSEHEEDLIPGIG
jgi:hypothetical protein